jgi:hypothetical protein
MGTSSTADLSSDGADFQQKAMPAFPASRKSKPGDPIEIYKLARAVGESLSASFCAGHRAMTKTPCRLLERSADSPGLRLAPPSCPRKVRFHPTARPNSSRLTSKGIAGHSAPRRHQHDVPRDSSLSHHLSSSCSYPFPRSVNRPQESTRSRS